MQKMPGGCRRGWSVLPLHQTPGGMTLTLILLSLTMTAKGAVYWAYFPDPPLLHPTMWQGPEVIVKVSNTSLLDMPSMGRMIRQSAVFNYTGFGVGLPICFVANGTAPGCLNITRQSWSEGAQVVRLGAPDGHVDSSIQGAPQEFRPCGKGDRTTKKTILWKRCCQEKPVRYNVGGANHSILDWSKPLKYGTEISAGLWQLESGHWQTYLWKLAAAMQYVIKGYEKGNGTMIDKGQAVQACVNSPQVLLSGAINITWNETQFEVTCENCNLSNCISLVPDGTVVMVLHQSFFVMIPVNITGPWYADRGLQVIEKINNALSRQRRVIGLIVAGILAIVSLIATAATAAVALTQTVQTAHYVNNLSRNVTLALGTREDIDRKLEQKLDALYETVEYLGDEIQGL
ncbi:endogenous retrovirus group K member 113 Env polyprotein-like [Pteropus medius]|uniref:endogenous retrovirus group K member 113 Env polyprotein-like n=1 Tax=Pteropus vampyrus TaxID=132908 RepID=UPI00196AF1CF|nr:endogenous retrovirus group K member 113 Env polyprotein-like [Pteropus giganteus]